MSQSDPAREGDVLYRRDRYAPSPLESRRVIPSGDVSPDGRRGWPRPSMTSRVLVLGGMGLAAAAATAGAVLAVRAIVDGIAGDDEDDALEAARRRARARAIRPPQHARATSMRFAATGRDDPAPRAAERARIEGQRHAAPKPRPAPEPASLVDSVNSTVTSVTDSVREAMTAVTAAIQGFRSVATQAGGIIEDFKGAADQVRSFLEPSPTAGTMPRNSHARPAKRDVVDLRESDMAGDKARRHRL